MKRVIGIAVFFICLMATVSYGFTKHSCTGGVIRVGNRKATVMRKCGEPSLVDREGATSADASQSQGSLTPGEEPGSTSPGQTRGMGATVGVTKSVEKWTYNFGPGQFVKILTFEGSRLISIEDGDYGW